MSNPTACPGLDTWDETLHCPLCDATLRDRVEALALKWEVEADHAGWAGSTEHECANQLRAVLVATPPGAGGDLTDDEQRALEDGINLAIVARHRGTEATLRGLRHRLAPCPEVPR